VIIPPVKVVEGGVIVDDVFRLILAQIRSKHETAGDFPRADRGEHDRCEASAGTRRPARPRETIVETMGELLDYTERRNGARRSQCCRSASTKPKASVDTDGYSDEPVKLKARVEISAGGVHFDLTGSDPQRRAPGELDVRARRSRRAPTP